MPEDPVEEPEGIQRKQAAPPWAAQLTHLLDDFLRVPGTDIRFGLDAVLGLLAPGAGDAFSAAGGLALLALAFRMRVPSVVMARMVMNLAIDALFGIVPFAGDLFDFAFKANRKNLELVQRFQRPGARVKPTDYVVVALCFAAVLALVVLPVVLATLFISRMIRGEPS